jgi:hypothetical protein
MQVGTSGHCKFAALAVYSTRRTPDAFSVGSADALTVPASNAGTETRGSRHRNQVKPVASGLVTRLAPQQTDKIAFFVDANYPELSP